MGKIRPITLQVEERVWEAWKVTVPRTITLSKAIEGLIIDDLNDKNISLKEENNGTKS